jgi:hypothetical protein
MSVVYLMASFLVSNPSWIVDSIHKTLWLGSMSEQLYVGGYRNFYLDYLFLVSSLIISSHQFYNTWLLGWWRNTIFFIVLGQCFISYVCGCFTICKWYLNITYPKKEPWWQESHSVSFLTLPPSIMMLLSMNWKSLAYGSASNKPLGM